MTTHLEYYSARQRAAQARALRSASPKPAGTRCTRRPVTMNRPVPDQACTRAARSCAATSTKTTDPGTARSRPGRRRRHALCQRLARAARRRLHDPTFCLFDRRYESGADGLRLRVRQRRPGAAGPPGRGQPADPGVGPSTGAARAGVIRSVLIGNRDRDDARRLRRTAARFTMKSRRSSDPPRATERLRGTPSSVRRRSPPIEPNDKNQISNNTSRSTTRCSRSALCGFAPSSLAFLLIYFSFVAKIAVDRAPLHDRFEFLVDSRRRRSPRRRVGPQVSRTQARRQSSWSTFSVDVPVASVRGRHRSVSALRRPGDPGASPTDEPLEGATDFSRPAGAFGHFHQPHPYDEQNFKRFRRRHIGADSSARLPLSAWPPARRHLALDLDPAR